MCSDPSSAPRDAAAPLDRLREIVARLREPGGCPWDREQTHRTLRAALLEEAYEAVAAIDAADEVNLCEELGDLLLQVVFHSRLAEENGQFGFDDVARAIADKLVRRHPHVFGDTECADTAAVLRNWEQLKRVEKGSVGASALEGVPHGLPALLRAAKVQQKAARVGFDWSEAAAVFAKVREELDEVEHVLADRDRREEEIGDLLFSVVNLARKLTVDAEVALHSSTGKFVRRFEAMEELARARNLSMDQLSLGELDALWAEVKGIASHKWEV